MYTVFVAGMAAPLFLFLAGLTIAMAASSRAVKVGHAAAAAHGAQARPADLRARLPVPAAVAAARLGRAQQLPEGRHPQRDGHRDDRGRDHLGTVGEPHRPHRAVRDRDGRGGDETPLVREAGDAGGAARCRSRPTSGRCPAAPTSRCSRGRGSCSPARSPASWSSPRRPNRRSGACRPGFSSRVSPGIVVGYAASFRPSIYPVANFWTSSPTFFFIRLGILHGDAADRLRHRSLPRVRAAAVRQLLLGARRARPRHHHARPLVAVRVLDSRRDGLRRPSPGRSSARCRSSCRCVATVALCALLYKIVRLEGSQDGRTRTDGRVANLRAV